MGTFYVKCRIENPVNRTRSAIISKLLVDTGSEYSWVPERTLERIGIRREKKDIAFVLANGQQVTRSVGFAIIRLDKFFTIDEVVFAEPNDPNSLGRGHLKVSIYPLSQPREDLWLRGLFRQHRRPERVQPLHRVERASGSTLRLFP